VLWLWRDRIGSYHASVHREDGHEELGEFQRLEVTSVKLDDYCALSGVEHIDWLKLDCEGHELRVLAGADLLMQLGRISVIQFEFNELAALAGNTFLSFWTLLTRRGFALYREGVDALEPIPSYTHELTRPARRCATTWPCIAARGGWLPSVVAIVRDEGPYLAEWVAFHRLQGFDRFLIYDNESSDDGPELAESLGCEV
jgi:hypothetical protein